MTVEGAAGQLSDRDLAVLRGLGDLGFMSAGQIQRCWFDAPDVSPIGARRRTQRVLHRLTERRLLSRIDRRHGGSRGGSAAFTYRLDARGRRAAGLTGRGGYREPSERFVDHSLAISELHVQLVEAERRGHITDVSLGHEPGIWRRFPTASGIETLKPDLLVELTTADGWELRWFVEIDRGTEHLPTVLAKAHLYERYWRSGHEATRNEVFPRVAWSVPDDRRVARVSEALQCSRSLTADLHRVVTTAETAELLTTNQEPKGGQP